MHDIIVIGGSAGALEPLCDLLKALPPQLPASVFVVIHIPEKNSALEGSAAAPERAPRHTREPGRAISWRPRDGPTLRRKRGSRHARHRAAPGDTRANLVGWWRRRAQI